MKVSGAKKVHYESGPNMTPLVDIVMVILIFLMLAGSFGGMEQYLQSNLPIREAGKGEVKSSKAFDDVQLDIRVDGQAGQNSWVAQFGGNTYRTPDDLRNALENKFKEYKNLGTGKEKLQVIINPNRFVKWKSLIIVYQTAMLAGYEKIGFSQAH